MDKQFMQTAIDLAKTAEGQTGKNPLVGAVVVKNNQVVGLGAHLMYGEPHAEVNALTMAGSAAEGSTLYVTLEPCNHHGKTPPCTELIISSRVKRVVIGSKDPNPIVNGKGIKRLQDAGIAVTEGILKEECDQLNTMLFHSLRTGLPFVTLKSAVSLDGKTAVESGESKWITGEEARKDVHLYRSSHQSILVGVNTVIQDDPSLTARLPNVQKQPVRVVLDSSLKIPLHSKVLNDREAETWIFTTNQANAEKVNFLKSEGIRVFQSSSQQPSVREVLRTLASEGIYSVFVEGGSKVHSSFLKDQLYQQLIIYYAPKLIGGKSSPGLFSDVGFQSMKDVPLLTIHSISKIGRDFKLIAAPSVENFPNG
ncbi:bifunctional diaminohydroxyphosphoribosylaminopyrimidine deaminase/5-amino-6-(5-phosphoribosylamino)uracil reductase RibD [Bacillus gobiensis]|uniref:bifunctional diaminohydroxyphosphoribosylaminopyrimidine deaminase/5-amino-6-(5-phosphoribosylamino)uracil reductase RibD n=1 Tax=Bacillus gobiensis TaxID=1441095 RepID=UPI003D1E2BF7